MASEKLTRVYQYGLLRPTMNVVLIEEQLWLAREYHWDLLQLARARRAVEREVEAEAGLRPELATVSALLDNLDAALDAAEQARKSNGRRTAPPELRAAVTKARHALDAAVAAMRERRKELYDAMRPQRDAVAERWRAMRRSYRLHYAQGRGLRHGTYTAVEDAVARSLSDTPLYDADGRPQDPRMPDRDRGQIGVQCKNHEGILTGENTFVQVHLDEPRSNSRRAMLKRRGQLWLRVGTGKKRRPIWAVWPIIMHRPFPSKGQVQRVTVHRRRVGPTWRWTVGFIVREPATETPSRGSGVVAVSVGWKKLDDGSLRVAEWCDGTNSGELALSEFDVRYARKPDDLRSIRDKNMVRMRKVLCRMLRSSGILPGWLRRLTVRRREGLSTSAEAVAVMARWRTPSHFARLCRLLRENGELPAVLELLEAWRKQDRHLWTWEAHQRQKALRRRREKYRLLAHQLANRYSTIVLEQLDLSKEARRKHVRDEEEERANSLRQLACVHQLRDCICYAAVRYGAQVFKVGVVRDKSGQSEGGARALLGRWESHKAICKPKTKRNKHMRDGESRWERVARLRAEKEARMALQEKKRIK